jgi:hypothetical protein
VEIGFRSPDLSLSQPAHDVWCDNPDQETDDDDHDHDFDQRKAVHPAWPFGVSCVHLTDSLQIRAQ